MFCAAKLLHLNRLWQCVHMFLIIVAVAGDCYSSKSVEYIGNNQLKFAYSLEISWKVSNLDRNKLYCVFIRSFNWNCCLVSPFNINISKNTHDKQTNTHTHTQTKAKAEEKHRPRVRERGTATLLLSSSTEIIACLPCRIAFAISHTTIQLSHKITINGTKFQHTLTAFLTINI